MVDFNRIGQLPKVDLSKDYKDSSTDDSSSITSAVKRGVAGGIEGLGRSIQEAGAPSLGKPIRGAAQALEESAGPSAIQSIRDIKENPVGAIKEAIGNVAAGFIPTAAGVLSGGAAGMALGGPPGAAIGAGLGAMIPSSIAEFGEIKRNQDISGVQDNTRAAIGALSAGALDALEVGALAKVLPKGTLGKGVEGLTEKLLKPGFTGSTLTRATKGAVTAGGAEAIQEGAQSAIEQTAGGMPLNPEDIGLSAAMGAIGGGALGAPLGALNKQQQEKQTVIPGTQSKFTNKDIEKSLKTAEDSFTKAAGAIDLGEDHTSELSNLEALKEHLTNNFISPKADESGKTPTAHPADKIEAEAVLKNIDDALGLLNNRLKTKQEISKPSEYPVEEVKLPRERQLDTALLNPELEKRARLIQEQNAKLEEDFKPLENIDIEAPLPVYDVEELERPPTYDVQEVPQEELAGKQVNPARAQILAKQERILNKLLPTDLVTKSGKPYVSEGAAKRSFKTKGLSEDTHTVVKIPDGFVIRQTKEIPQPAEESQREAGTYQPSTKLEQAPISEEEIQRGTLKPGFRFRKQAGIIYPNTSESSSEPLQDTINNEGTIDAEEVRIDQEQPPEAGQVSTGSEEDRSSNLHQPEQESQQGSEGTPKGQEEVAVSQEPPAPTLEERISNLDTQLEDLNNRYYDGDITESQWNARVDGIRRAKAQLLVQLNNIKIKDDIGDVDFSLEDSLSSDNFFDPDLFNKNVYYTPDFKSREILISLPIDEFLSMAAPIKAGESAKLEAGIAADKNIKWSSLPFLQFYFDERTGIAKVEGHEGRHRALYLKSKGYTHLPVILRGNIRWSEQNNSNKFDYKKIWPSLLEAEETVKTIRFPVNRTETGLQFNIEKYIDSFTLEKSNQFRKYVENLNSKLNIKGVKLVYADSILDIEDKEIIKYHENRNINPKTIGGLYHKTPFGKVTIYVFGQNKENLAQLQRTIFHELVGHYGVRKVLGNDWENFLDRMINNPVLASEIYALSPRWHNIEKEFPVKGNNHITVKTPNGPVKVSRQAMRGLADELIAIAAGNLPKQGTRKITEGISKEQFSFESKQIQTLMKKVVQFIKHILRKLGLYQYSEKATAEDILKAVSKSYEALFDTSVKMNQKNHTFSEIYANIAEESFNPVYKQSLIDQYEESLFFKGRLVKKNEFNSNIISRSGYINARTTYRNYHHSIQDLLNKWFNSSDFSVIQEAGNKVFDNKHFDYLNMYKKTQEFLKEYLPNSTHVTAFVGTTAGFDYKAPSYNRATFDITRAQLATGLTKDEKLLAIKVPIENIFAVGEREEGEFLFKTEGSYVLGESSESKTTLDGDIQFSIEAPKSMHELSTEGYGDLNQSASARFVKQIESQLSATSLRKFMHLGGLPHKAEFARLNQKALGDKYKVDQLTNSIKGSMRNLNIIEKEKVLDFLTTSNANTEDLKNILSDDLINNLVSAKQKIVDYGETLVQLGLLNQETFEENKGSYIRTRYVEFLGESKGSGKLGSFQNYLKKKGDLTAEQKAQYIQIRDPEFLLVDTLGTIGRDVALLKLFHNVNLMSDKYNLPWVIGGKDFIVTEEIDELGNKVPLTFEDALARLERLNDAIKNEGKLYGLDSQRLADVVKVRDKLQQDIQTASQKLDEKIAQFSKDEGLTEPLTPKQYQSQYYQQLPKGKRYGKLSGMYVRKEIYDDLRDAIESFTGTGTQGDIARFLERAHGYWKFSKVVANPAGWFRNGIGNFVLLDIASPTNSVKLGNIFADEVSGAIKKNPSKYWTIAVDNGAFGTTYSANELYLYEKEFESEIKRLHRKYSDNPFTRFMSNVPPKVFAIMEKLSHNYGLVEGSFKVVAIRDYIERWEKEKGIKFDSLEGNEREIVISSAMTHANNSIFDYSAVPSFVKFARKYPLGTPFITFIYKAFPQVIRSFIRYPQKFVKYAVLPMLMHQLFLAMNPDLDDDDYEEIVNKMPSWMKDHNSIYLLPMKDDNGKWQAVNFGYFLPWEPFMDYGLWVNNHFEANGVSGTAYSVLGAANEALLGSLGILGGPVPTTISALISNKDPFTKQDIIPAGLPPDEKLAKMITHIWSIGMPPWLTDYGIAGKVLDQMNIAIPPISSGTKLTRYGTDKETVGQTISKAVGVNVYGFDPSESHQSNIKQFQKEEADIKNSMRTMQKNPNVPANERVEEMKKYNQLLLAHRNKVSEYMRKVEGKNEE